MKETRQRGLPVFPGAMKHYYLLTAVIILETIAVIAQAYFLARAITALFERTSITEVFPIILAFFVFFILRHVMILIEQKMASYFAVKTTKHLRNELFTTYVNQPQVTAWKKGTGHLITLAMEGIDNVRKYLEIIGIRTIRSGVIPLAIVLYVFFFDRISVFIFIVSVPIIIFFMILLGIAAEKLADKQYATYVRLANHFVDALKGLETLMFLGKSKRHAQNISFVGNEYRKATMRTLRVAFLSSFALDFFSSLSIAFVAVGLGFRLIDGSITLLPALTILILAPEYYRPIKDVGKDYHATLDGQVALQEINSFVDTKLAGRQLQSSTSELHEPQTIQLIDVTVSIGETTILENLNVTFNKGMIGVIGASGAGKSTFIHMLAGRIPFASGNVKVNGAKLDSLYDANWFKQIAYIPQHPYIFPLSLADNIRFYEPRATDEQVWEIVEKIGLAKVVEKFPDGIHEMIGEGHRRLSGGQEQRIVMARALLSDKPIILLDEPTAHLDILTEYEMKQLMLELFENRFVFIATHRLHWMQDMDAIVLFEQGKIVEQGTHEMLMESGAHYRHFVAWKEGLNE